jgi:hypothetical protein
MGQSRDDLRYIGTLDPQGRVLDSPSAEPRLSSLPPF